MATENPSLQSRTQSVESGDSSLLSIERFINLFDDDLEKMIGKRIPKIDRDLQRAREESENFQSEFIALISERARAAVRLNQPQQLYIRSVLSQAVDYPQGGGRIVIWREKILLVATYINSLAM